MYNEVLKDLERIEKSDFTAAEFCKIPSILLKIEHAYDEELPEVLHIINRPPLSSSQFDPRGKQARDHKESVTKQFEEILFKKLKEKLDLSDDTIISIISANFVHPEEKYETNNTYVIDDEFISRVSTSKSKARMSGGIKNYYNVSYPTFSDGAKREDIEEFAYTINKVLGSLPLDLSSDKHLLYVNDANRDLQVGNDTNGIGVFANHTLREIFDDKEGHLDTTVVIASFDNLYSYIIKCIKGYLLIRENNQPAIDVNKALGKGKKK